MKKLLILAVLALGLCASPALAGTLDFTKVDDAFIDALNSQYKIYNEWNYDRGYGTCDFIVPGTEDYLGPGTVMVIRFEFEKGFEQGQADPTAPWYKSAGGISFDTNGGLNGYGHVTLRFFSTYDERVSDREYGIPAEGLSLSFGAVGMEAYAQVTSAIRWDFQNEIYSYSDEKNKDLIDANGLATINFADLATAEYYLGSELSLSPTDTIIPATITLSSITHPNISSNYNPVPVPAAVWLLGTGVAGVAALRRKFK